MKDQIRQGLSRIKRRAAPVDRRLRGVPGYVGFRDTALELYRTSSWAAKPDQNVYVREYHRTQVNPRLALFDSFWGRRVTGNSFAIFIEMYHDPALADMRFVWVKNADTLAPPWMYDNDRISFVEHGSIEYARALLAAKYLVGNSNFKDYFVRKPDQIYVNPWHGIMLKKLGRDIAQPLRDSANTQRNFNQSSLITLSSKWVVDRIVDAYGVVFGHDRALETGSPRIDLTLCADPQEIRQHLGVPEGKKVLLYAPTWRGDVRNVSTEISAQLRAIEAMVAEFGDTHEVFVSLHNYVAQALTGLPPGPRLVPDDIPINEVLAAVDVLVSDYSSIFFDFFVLDRPVVLFAYDRAEYTATRGMYMDLEELPVAIASDNESLLAAIAQARTPSEFDGYTAAMEKYLPHEDGKASRRVVDAMLAGHESSDHDGPTRLLFSVGTLDPGPMSESFLALVRQLDPAKYHCTVVVGATAVDRDVKREIIYDRLPEGCDVVARRGEALVPSALQSAYARWLEGQATAADAKSLEPWLALEARRVLGGIPFDVAINFTLNSVFWTKFLTLATTQRRVLAINSSIGDLQRYADPGVISSVLGQFDRYDAALFFSDDLLSRNANLFRTYHPNIELGVVRPSIDPNQVRELASKHRDVSEELSAKIMFDRSFEHDGETPIYAAIGDFTPERRHDRLLRAFKVVLEERPGALLVLIGDGPLRSRVSDLARRLEVAGSVVFAGHLDNYLPTLAMAERVIVGSEVDLDWVTVEQSLAVGKPTIVTDLAASINIDGCYPVVGAGVDDLVEAMMQDVPPSAPEAGTGSSMAGFARLIASA